MRFIRPGGRPAATAAAIAMLILGAHSTAAAQTKAVAIADTIRALEVARGQALMKADTTAIARMTADEFIEVSRLGQLRTKADNLRDLSSGALKLTPVRYDSTTVQVYGGGALFRAIAGH